MLYFGTEGCSYCWHFVERSLGDPEIAKRVQQHFNSIAFEIFDDLEMVTPEGRSMRVKAFAASEGAEFSPTVVFLDTQGRRVLRIVGYYPPGRFDTALDYVVGGFHDRESFREYAAVAAEQGTSPPDRQELIRESLFASPPYLLNRSRMAAERPLMVLFEQKACPACLQFHGTVLKDPAIRSLLHQFEVVRLDAGDRSTPVITPKGARTRPHEWAMSLDLTHSPSLVFFDEHGQQVLKVDTLVLRQRMVNSLNYVLEKAYERGMSYQRFARTKALEKSAGK